MLRLKIFLSLLLFMFLAIGLAAAQTGQSGGGTGTGSTGSTGSTGTGTGNRGTINVTTSTQRQQQPTQQLSTPIFLSGKVVMEDGRPAPHGVSVERVCAGQVRREGYTDSHGQFGFQVGQGGVMQDASMSGMDSPFGSTNSVNNPFTSAMGNPSTGIQDRDLVGCELRATLVGYRSDIIDLSMHQRLDNPDVGIIVLHPLGKVEGTIISVTSLQAPKDAKKALEKGRDLLKKGKTEEAEAQFQKAVTVYPKYAEAWSELGVLAQKAGRVDDARKDYTEAMTADSKFLRPYFGMLQMAGAKRDWQQVADLSDHALSLDSYSYAELYFYNSVAYYNLRKMDMAEKSARNARRLDSQHRNPRINLLLGDILAQRKDYAEAADELRTYLKFVSPGPDAESAKLRLSNLEKLAGPPRADAAPDKPKE